MSVSSLTRRADLNRMRACVNVLALAEGCEKAEKGA
jgi:hypothetical protein